MIRHTTHWSARPHDRLTVEEVDTVFRSHWRPIMPQVEVLAAEAEKMPWWEVTEDDGTVVAVFQDPAAPLESKPKGFYLARIRVEVTGPLKVTCTPRKACECKVRCQCPKRWIFSVDNGRWRRGGMDIRKLSDRYSKSVVTAILVGMAEAMAQP